MRKNILILAHNYGMQFIEGCNQYTQLFDQKKYHVTVAYLIGAEDSIVKQKTEAETILFLNFPSSAIRGLKLSAIKKVYQLCRKNNYEMVFCHRYKPTYIMLWVSLFCRIPKMFFVMHAIETMRSIPRRLLAACLLQKNMTFIGVSNAVRDDLRRDMWRIPADKITTFYNIMDYELFEPQLHSAKSARSLLNIPEEAFVFGTIGRFVKEKDQQTLIQAFALIHAQCPQSKLVFIGDGKLELELKKQTKDLHLENHVIFSGFIPDGFRFMKAFDVFVLNSVEEAFGRVLLEAMLANTPVIATRSDGIPEVVGDTGLIVTAKNPKELADAMLKTYQLPKSDLAVLGKKGYDRMKETFSIHRFKEIFWESFAQ